MQLQKESNPALNTITAYDVDYVDINQKRYTNSIYFQAEGPIHTLDARASNEITAELLNRITGLDHIKQDPLAFLDGDAISLPANAPEVVLIGTGTQQLFLHPKIYGDLLKLRIGVEVMDTRAAARTYNILMSEGRKVIALLII